MMTLKEYKNLNQTAFRDSFTNTAKAMYPTIINDDDITKILNLFNLVDTMFGNWNLRYSTTQDMNDFMTYLGNKLPYKVVPVFLSIKNIDLNGVGSTSEYNSTNSNGYDGFSLDNQAGQFSANVMSGKSNRTDNSYLLKSLPYINKTITDIYQYELMEAISFAF